MSSITSALKGASYQGFTKVTELGARGMIILRGDLSSDVLQRAACDLAGCDFPETCQIQGTCEGGLCWMSPDEILILCPYETAHDGVDRLSAALAGTHHLVANVSDARAMLSLSGGAPREVIAKLSPADLSPEAFAPGTLRRSRLAQVPAAFWTDDTGVIHVICFRSVAQYVFDLLSTAALPGNEVDFFDPA